LQIKDTFVAKMHIMKRTFLLLTLLIIATAINAQNRIVARGATPGELYIQAPWYGTYNPGPPFYDTLRMAVYYLTENGKKLTIQYAADYFANPEYTMQPQYILADATPGVLYNKSTYSKNSYTHTQLCVSFDYGKNWVFREENIGTKYYYSANIEGLMFKGGGGFYMSLDYGYTFSETDYGPGGTEPGLQNGEAFTVWSINPPYSYQGQLRYTCDFGENYLEIPIDNQYVYYSSDAYRGALSGEVYINSEFPDPDYYTTYKVSFSADTGHTFRHVFVSESFTGETIAPLFMSDREAGVFYIIRRYQVEDFPLGWHTKVCVEYYRDYGETLVDTYCHELTKNYEGVGVKEVKELEGVRVFPNPTTGELTINNEQLIMNNVEVFDVFGRKLLSHHLITSSSPHKIDISDLRAGIYFVRIITEKGIITKKVVKM
jgi:hypothetical protein